MAPDDKGKFKVPSIRNVTATAPYMHDGRFATLRDVIEHYRFGVKESPTLDPLLRRGNGDLGFVLTDTDVTDLLAFCEALHDEGFLTSPEYNASEK